MKYPVKIIIFLIVILIISVAIWHFRSNSKQPVSGSSSSGVNHQVVLSDSGFSPSEITINQGDTVTFTTTAGKEFWPASDPHPAHSIYPEFDPKQPIPASSSWSFTFDKVGSWKYHDHLFFTHRGIIIVKAP